MRCRPCTTEAKRRKTLNAPSGAGLRPYGYPLEFECPHPAVVLDMPLRYQDERWCVKCGGMVLCDVIAFNPWKISYRGLCGHCWCLGKRWLDDAGKWRVIVLRRMNF
jgi:hypothetical protein